MALDNRLHLAEDCLSATPLDQVNTMIKPLRSRCCATLSTVRAKPRPTPRERGLLTQEAADLWMAGEALASQAVAPVVADVVALRTRFEAQVAELREGVAAVEGELREATDFADGLLVVLAHVVPTILRAHPDLAAMLQPQWALASERYEAVTAGGPVMVNESAELLDARRLLFRLGNAAGVWPSQDGGQSRNG